MEFPDAGFPLLFVYRPYCFFAVKHTKLLFPLVPKNGIFTTGSEKEAADLPIVQDRTNIKIETPFQRKKKYLVFKD